MSDSSNIVSVDSDQSLFDQLVHQWRTNGRPGEFDALGKRWIYMRDNDRVFFVEKGGGSGFDSRYSGNSFA